jgi:RNA polymerase-binding transcription factor DksA
MATDSPVRSDRRTLRGLLHARRRELTEELTRRRMRIREAGENPAPVEDPDNDDSGDLEVVLVDIATATLHRIEQAIERLDEGRYGVCARCRREIPDVRLRALPFAVCCQECEAAREREGPDRHPLERRRHWTPEGVAGEWRHVGDF